MGIDLSFPQKVIEPPGRWAARQSFAGLVYGHELRHSAL